MRFPRKVELWCVYILSKIIFSKTFEAEHKRLIGL